MEGKKLSTEECISIRETADKIMALLPLFKEYEESCKELNSVAGILNKYENVKERLRLAVTEFNESVK